VVIFLINAIQNNLTVNLNLPIHEIEFKLRIFLVICLMPMNWFLEIYKWGLIKGSSKVKSASSVQILRGIALNWVLPFTLGDLVSKIENTNDLKTKSINIFNHRVTSLLVTVFFGVFGLLNYQYFNFRINTETQLILFSFLGICILISCYLLNRSFGNYMLVSMVRYLVFTLQYILLFSYYLPNVPLMVIFAGITWTLLIKTVLPGLFGSLGIREAAAWVFFSYWVDDPLNIITPSLIVWFVNMVLPSLVGNYFLAKNKFITE
jgi:hypothetical protein